MAERKSWAQVQESPAYKALSPAEKELARQQYFEKVIAPQVGKEELEIVRTQFDAATKARKLPTEDDNMTGSVMLPDPTEGMGEFRKFAASFGRFFPQIGQAVGKLGRDVAEIFPGGEKAANFVGLPTADDVSERKRRDAPLLATNAGFLGDVARNVAGAAPLAVAPGGATILGSMGYGAAYPMLTEPAADWGDRGKNALTSATVSGGVTGAMRGAPALWNAFVSPMTGRGRERMALDTVNRFAQDPNAVRNALTHPAPPGAPSNAELIPGSRATLAEVTEDPGIAQAQRTVHAASPEAASELAANHTARVAARKNALTGIAGDDSERAFLRANRDATAEQLYENAYTKGIDIFRNPTTGTFLPKAQVAARKGEITKLLQSPTIREAVEDAKRIALDARIADPKAARNLKLNDMTGSVEGLHYVKKALDSQLEKAVSAGDASAARRIGGLQRRLLTTVDALSPEYAAARNVYADMSKPVNRSEVGKFLYDKLIPALSDAGAERLTPQQFAKVLRDGDAMAAKATGYPGTKLNQVLTRDDTNLLNNLVNDLGRETGAIERARVPGSPTAQYLSGKNVLRQMLGPVGLPESWSEKMFSNFMTGPTSLLMHPVERDVQNRLALMLSDPRRAVAAQTAADRTARSAGPRVGNALRQYALPPTAVGLGATSAGSQ